MGLILDSSVVIADALKALGKTMEIRAV